MNNLNMQKFKLYKSLTASVLICLLLALSGCATTSNKDPFEGYNRAVYKFNDVTDKAVIKPIAGAYKAVTPPPIKKGVSNFFGNIRTLISAINDILQLKLDHAMTNIGRFVINSTIGVAGLIDVASMDDMPRYDNDFGKTLASWGVGEGPFTMLPFFGPSTWRDSAGLAMDTIFFDPVSYLRDPRARNQIRIVRGIDYRAQLLPGSDLIDDAALDPYAFLRDAYLQRRRADIGGQVDTPTSEFPTEDNTPDTEPQSAPAQSENQGNNANQGNNQSTSNAVPDELAPQAFENPEPSLDSTHETQQNTTEIQNNNALDTTTETRIMPSDNSVVAKLEENSSM